MAGQGRSVTKIQVRNILRLLSSTDMTIAEIAERVGCSKSLISSVNRKYSVRAYKGRRSRWDTARILRAVNDRDDDLD